MSDKREPVTSMTKPRRRFGRLMTVALALALVCALIGGTVVVNMWWRTDAFATASEQEAPSNPAETGAQATR